MNFNSKPHTLFWSSFHWKRLVVLGVAGLYSSASTLSGGLVLLLMDFSILGEAAVGQTTTALPQDTVHDYAQLPSLPTPPPPSESIAPTPTFGPIPSPEAPPPPLGYPDESPNVSSPEQFNRYRLGIGDAVAVTVQRFPDLSFTATVNLEGKIIVPLLGTLPVVGLTLEGLQEQLRAGFSRFVVDPEVAVVLTGVRPAQITVAGEVVRPGFYQLAPGSQLTGALFAAGGATTLADLRTIIVRRRSPDNNSIIEQQVDLFTPLQNGTSLPDLRLQDGDAVVVAKLEQDRLQDYDRTLVSRSSVAQPQITIRVLSYPNGRIGNITLPNGSTFVDALTALAPSLDDANLRRIAVIRFDPEQGQAVSQQIDGRRALLGDVSQDVPLQNDDVIVVGRNLIARINYALRLVTRPFTDILSFRAFFNNLSNFFGLGSDDNSN